MKLIILAAGIGSRLGMPFPKPLTVLSNGMSIMQRQVKGFTKYFNIDDIIVVVGYKKELIMEAFSNLTFVYNDRFDTTNTSKSLLLALRKCAGHDVIWINGDVVLEHQVVGEINEFAGSCMAVNTESVGEEEIKYLVLDDGSISEVSKTLENGLGEAVGINKILKEDLELLIRFIEDCDDNDYFEKGIELAVNAGLKIYPLDISRYLCIEVDFVDDLDKVNKKLLEHKNKSSQ